jgi:hypothetical protein
MSEACSLAPELLRSWLLQVLDPQTVDRLISKRPDLAETAAVATGEARLRTGMSPRPLSAFGRGRPRLIDLDLADAGSFLVPLPNFDLDAELQRIRELARALVARGTAL